MASHRARVAVCTERAATEADNETSGRKRKFQRPDADGGQATLLVDEPGNTVDVDLLHGSTSYLSMLHDVDRNTAYAEGLKASIPTDAKLCLDLGAGTGLLAMMACRAQPGLRAVACEVYSACAKLAERVVEQNGLSDRIDVVSKVASDLQVGIDLPDRADVCVFELFDSQLLGESIIQILRDAHARLLKPGAVLVPSSVRLKAVLVECGELSSADVPEVRGAAWPIMLGQLGLFETAEKRVVRPICDVWDASRIDFATLPPLGPNMRQANVRVTASGVAHAVAWWWELDMGGGHSLSNWSRAASSRDGQIARHHWRPCLSFLAPRSVTVGEDVGLAALHDDEGVWFAWREAASTASLPPRWMEGMTSIPPERSRLMMAASSAWRQPLQVSLQEAGVSECLLLCVDDGLLLPVLAETCLAAGSHAISAVLPKGVAQRLEDAGRIPSGLQMAKSLKALTAAREGKAGFSTLLIEPFSPAADGPWSQVLSCRKRLSEVQGLLSKQCRILPSSAIVMAMLVECQGVWRARQPLGDICGLNLAAANASLVPRDCGLLDCAVAELAWRPLSAATELFRVDTNGSIPSSALTRHLTPNVAGTCHGVVVWVDFDMGSTAGRLTTGPPPPSGAPTGCDQALQLLEVPFDLADCSPVDVSVGFSEDGADITVRLQAPNIGKERASKRSCT
eukprot:TRINITY_DN18952_c0_g1_i1.p1 TRINITY_DN18952_c0_g1~~TRINITY_DN18952_c0_g1_i1.p1  ORF type:complete len:681 (-),score=95.16 TRINITY_DN18952_c0_g1_i1:480-2522(-)